VTVETTARTRREEPVDVSAELSLLVHLASHVGGGAVDCSAARATAPCACWHARIERPRQAPRLLSFGPAEQQSRRPPASSMLPVLDLSTGPRP
jgi:hypothetical protein